MSIKRIAVIAVLMGGWFAASPAAAGSLRCDNELVTRGDTAFDVVDSCGQPDWKTTRYEEIFYGRGRHEYQRRRLITIDEWIYRGRSGRFDRRLVFLDGRLHRIHLGERR